MDSLKLTGGQLTELIDTIDIEQQPELAGFRAKLEEVWNEIGDNHYTVGVDFSNYKLIKTKEVSKDD